MSIVDRYLCSVFVTTFLICFLSFAGLFIVVHLFSNLDELNAIATKFGWSAVFLEFYLPRIVDLFTKSTGILILFASVFSVSLLQRRREMTAMEAAGLTKLRILRPIFIISFILIGLTVANRELLIPRLQTQLARTPQSWGNTGKADMPTLTDENNVTVQGDRFYFADQRITDVQIELPTNVAPPTAPLRAETGFVKEAETCDQQESYWTTSPAIWNRFQNQLKTTTASYSFTCRPTTIGYLEGNCLSAATFPRNKLLSANSKNSTCQRANSLQPPTNPNAGLITANTSTFTLG